MSSKKTGRRGMGEVQGSDAKLVDRPDGHLKLYRIRLAKEQCVGLAAMLEDRAGEPPGRILAATGEKPERLRVLSVPVPDYELAAAENYVRGDVVRVTGTARSCNASLSRIGADLVRNRLSAALKRAHEWVEFRARVVRFRAEEGPRCLIELVPDVDVQGAEEDRRLGEAGVALAGSVWTAAEFEDWESSGA